MNSELLVNARLKIHPGKLQEFKAAAQLCLKSVREKDKGTLQYDWFLNDDETECFVFERYNDSQSLMDHMANLGDTMGALLSCGEFSAEVFGTPSKELLAATAGMDIKIYHYFQRLDEV
jgi:quinol monooxygenase YgiN